MSPYVYPLEARPATNFVATFSVTHASYENRADRRARKYKRKAKK